MGKQTIFVLLGTLCLLSGCNGNNPTPGPTPTPDPVPTPKKYYYITSLKMGGVETQKNEFSSDLRSVVCTNGGDDVQTFELNNDYQPICTHHTVPIIELNEYFLFEYNEDGTISKRKLYEGGLEESNLLEVTNYSYEAGKLVLEETFDIEDGKECPENKYVFSHENNAEEFSFYRYGDGGECVFIYAERVVTTYEENTYTQTYYRKENINEEFYVYYIDKFDTKTNKVLYTFYASDSYYSKCDRNENGDVIKQSSGYLIDNVENPTAEMVYTYDENDYLTKVATYDIVEGVKQEYGYIDFEVNEDGAVTKETQYLFDESTTTYSEFRIYEYELIAFDEYIEYYDRLFLLAYQQGHNFEY